MRARFRREEPQVEDIGIVQRLICETTVYMADAELHKKKMDEILATLPENDPNAAMKLLFRLWADHYNEHMKTTGHDVAVETILKQLLSLEPIFAKGGMQPIVGSNVLEMSGGTGMVIEALERNLPSDKVGDMAYTLNDITHEMQEIARKFLIGTVRGQCTHTNYDIRELGGKFDKKFSLIILSQTLHLIADEEALRNEKLGVTTNENAHVQEKSDVISSAFKLLEPGGTMLIIDEWPARLSNEPGKDGLEAAITYLFNRTFKPLESPEMLRALMRNIPDARSVVELIVPIDSLHSMHGLVFRKDDDKAAHKKNALPHRKYRTERNAAFSLVIGAFETTAPYLQQTIATLNGNMGITLQPLNDQNRLIVSDTSQLPKNASYDSVILKECFHNNKRNEAISSAINSLKAGGWLIIADEWIPPEESENPTMRSDFTAIMAQFGKSITPGGAIRVPIVVGEKKHNSAFYANMYYKNKPPENGHK